MADTYKIVRYFQKGKSRTIQRGLTLEEAQAHCSDPGTSSQRKVLGGRMVKQSRAAAETTRKHGPWFDGYTKE